MMVSSTVRSLRFIRSWDCKMKSSSFLASPALRVTDASGGTIVDVSTIPSGKAVVVEGLASTEP